MNQRQYLIKGTFLLTLAGLLTRIAGFFYKIFLSRTIGSSEIGLFQLTVPVYSFCMAFACGGIQTALSRFTAEYLASEHKKNTARLLAGGILISGCMSLSAAALLWNYSVWIAERFLLEPQCQILLEILACSIPFSVLHSCLCGYFTGRKNIVPTCLSQIIEQFFRIASVFVFYTFHMQNTNHMNSSVMALGQLAGELSAALYCTIYLFFKCRTSSGSSPKSNPKKRLYLPEIRSILSVSVPLSLNRMLLCILQGFETALLPVKLKQFGLTSQEALSVYATFTGMALPLILFPTAVTSAVGTLLLPAVSEAKTKSQTDHLAQTIYSTYSTAFDLGCFFMTVFILFGAETASRLFNHPLAGIYVVQMSVLCPLLYLNTTMINIIHGLGKTTAVFLWNLAGFIPRIFSVVFLVPVSGIQGYLIGTLISQLLIAIFMTALLSGRKLIAKGLFIHLLRSFMICVLSGTVSLILKKYCPYLLLTGLFFFVSTLLMYGFLLLNHKQRQKLYLLFSHNCSLRRS